MRKVMLILVIAVVSISCAPNCNKNEELQCRYSMDDLFSLINNEKDFLYGAQLDSIYFIDSFFVNLSTYRTKLLSILKEEEILINFDNAFLIEDLFVYKLGIRKSKAKDFPFDYRAVIYLENSNCKTFLDVDISQDLKKFDIEKIVLSNKKDTFILNWLSKKTEINRQNLKDGFIDIWEEQYDVVSKLTSDEKFCRIFINLFWSGFYGVSKTPMTKQQIKNWRAVQDINYLTYLTGNGFAF